MIICCLSPDEAQQQTLCLFSSKDVPPPTHTHKLEDCMTHCRPSMPANRDPGRRKQAQQTEEHCQGAWTTGKGAFREPCYMGPWFPGGFWAQHPLCRPGLTCGKSPPFPSWQTTRATGCEEMWLHTYDWTVRGRALLLIWVHLRLLSLLLIWSNNDQLLRPVARS